jgi:subfamily B ATP-binding cassette protein MsbA
MIQLLREVLASFWWMRPHLRPGRWLLLSVVVCAFLGAPLEVAGVGLLLPMLIFLQGNDQARQELLRGKFLHLLPDLFPSRSDSFYFAALCGLIVLALILKNLVAYVAANLSSMLMSRCGDNLRCSLFQRMQLAPMRVFEEHKAGELASVFTAETVRTVNTMDFVLGLFQRTSIGVFMLAYIFLISWRVSVAFLVLVAVVAMLTGWLHRRLKTLGSQRSQLFMKMGGRLIEGFAGIRVVRATHSQGHQTAIFNETSSGIAAAERRATRIAGGMTPITEVLGVGGAMAILIGTYHLLIVPGRMPSEDLLFLGFLLIRLLPLVGQLHGFMGQLAYNFAGLKEVMRWLKIDPYPVRPFGTLPFASVTGGVRFRDVTFRYPNGKLALDRVSFDVPAGKTAALVGASGSGKSTLASLLIRLREPSEGRIEVDGVDHWQFASDSWHRGIGVVEQEAFLFHESVRQNICVGAPDASPEALAAALRIAHLDDVIAGLPAGLDTVVGERGTMLSGGQKQRLAIARAMVRNPRILVLDEATSALDNVSERQVQAALDDAREGRTSVVIAHRLSTIRNADVIVVLEEGRVVQQGSWSELAEREGSFRRLLMAARDGHLADAAA